MNYELKFLV